MAIIYEGGGQLEELPDGHSLLRGRKQGKRDNRSRNNGTRGEMAD